MHKPYYLIALLILLFGLQACQQMDKQQEGFPPALSDSLKISRLITKARAFQSGKMDSLPSIAQQIDSVSQINNNRFGLIYADIFRAHYNWLSAKYQDAMQIALKAMDNAEQWDIRQPIPEIYAIIANLHKENGNYDLAFKDCIKGLSEARANKDTSYIISLLGLRAMFTHGYYIKNGQHQDDHISLPLELQALEIAESSPKYETMRIRFYDNIAQTYKENKQYDKAILYANKAVALALKHHQLRSLTYAYNWLGEAHYYEGQRDTGIAYLNRAITLSRQLKEPYREMEIYEAMYWCYMADKNYEPAIMALRRSDKMRDSLQVAKNEKQIGEMQLKYDAGGKDRQIILLDQLNRLKSQKILRISVAMVCFVILMVIILYQYYTIHNYSRLMENNNEELNDALLKIAHIQSHQIRKPLASIMGLMNVIKANNYEPDKEVLQKMDNAAHELDKQIRDVIAQTEVVD